MFDADGRLARIAAAIDEVVAEELDASCAPPQSEVLLALLAQRERLDAEVVRRTGVWERAGEWSLDGAVTPASWLRSRARLDGAEASELVRTARIVHDHAPTADALRSGTVPARRAHQIARTVKDRHDAYVANPDLLLGPAATLPDDHFRVVTRRWREAVDDALAREEAFEQHERRYLHTSVTLAGMVAIDGLLDPEGGEALLAALEAAEQPDSADDPAPVRSASQRRADALVTLATEALAGPEHESPRPRVNLDAVMTIRLPDGEPVDLAGMHYELEHVGPVPRVTIERLACDCAVGRVLMNGK